MFVGMFILYSSAYFVRKLLSVVKVLVKEVFGFIMGMMGLIDSVFLFMYVLG